ncbi:hypothetical protein BS78_06G053300 [Paspalum vaginatum]|nr:hypothetical protein BS78_06G053300 [Paspalum vaginatum]
MAPTRSTARKRVGGHAPYARLPAQEEQRMEISSYHSAQASSPTPQEEMGWTCTKYAKTRDTANYAHGQLMDLLHAYHPSPKYAVEYFCKEYKHPLENTYRKTKMCIYGRDEKINAFEVDRLYRHYASRSTLEESMEDAAFEAFLDLRNMFCEQLADGKSCYIPRRGEEMGWAIIQPDEEDEDPTIQELVHFAH